MMQLFYDWQGAMEDDGEMMLRQVNTVYMIVQIHILK